MGAGNSMVAEVNTPTFSTESRVTTRAIVVKVRGNADSAVIEPFQVFLDQVGNAAQALRVQETVFDLKDLYFMNSSCMALFLRMVKRVIEHSIDKYAIRFCVNPQLVWQRQSLSAIRNFAPSIVVIE
jgi:anti-anti-sigma factor